MPIENTLFGVWRSLNFAAADGTFHNWVVDSFEEGTEQEAAPQYYVSGSPRSNILNIKGAVSNVKLTSPLLVSNVDYRWNYEDPRDGLAIWYNFVRNSMVWSVPYMDPGQMLRSASFSVDSTNGARYSVEVLADATFLADEAGATGPDQSNYYLDTDVAIGGMEDGKVFRVAQFYDFDVEVNIYNDGIAVPITGYLESLKVDVKVTSGDFVFIGQTTQRRMLGITGVEVTYSGTIVSDFRAPVGHQFPWQAMSPAGWNTYGGTAKAAVAGIGVWLRAGMPGQRAVSVLPNLSLYGDSVVGTASSLVVGPERIRTNFTGRSWMTSDDPFALTPTIPSEV